MIELWVLRHGKAEDDNGTKNDVDRALSKKGIAQINQLAQHLLDKEIRIEKQVISSAKRTQQTADIIAHHLLITERTFHEELYLADLDTIRQFVLVTHTTNKLMYVGHNFGISHFCSYLSGSRMSLSTGMCVHFSFDCDNWDEIVEGSGTIVSVFKPNIYQP